MPFPKVHSTDPAVNRLQDQLKRLVQEIEDLKARIKVLERGV